MKVVAMKDQLFDQGKHVFKKGHWYSCHKNDRTGYIINYQNGTQCDEVYFSDTFFHELFKFRNVCKKCCAVTFDDYPMEKCTKCEVNECESYLSLIHI